MDLCRPIRRIHSYVPAPHLPRSRLLTLLTHLYPVTYIAQALLIKPRLFWLLPTTVLCGIFELTGWFARAKSSSDPTNRNNFIIQYAFLILL